MRENLILLWCCISLLSLISGACSVSPRKADAADSGLGEGGSEEVSDLFIEGDASGETEFITNDQAYWSPLGYTLWCLNHDIRDPFIERSVTCSKISGDDIAGYGIIFCHYDDPDPAVGESMLAVMLNILGEYIVGEIIDDAFFQICPWTFSPFLSRGYNQSNIVRIILDGNEFDLYLNNQHVYSFTDEEGPLHTGGDNGYIVVISPKDFFPEDTVHVRFME